MTSVQIEARIVGRRKPIIPPWRLPIPEGWQNDVEPICLRDLIIRVVTNEVESFNLCQEQNQFLEALTNRQTAEQAQTGKIRFGGFQPQKADLNEALQTALQAYEDGLYYVFLDDQQITDLGERIIMTSESRVTFIRLVSLAGG
jgi:hypothetical protein